LLLRSAEAKPSLPRFVEYDVLSTRSRNATRAPPSGGQTTAPNTRRAKRRRRAPRPAGGGPAFGLCAWRRLVMGPSAPPWPRPLPGAIFEILAPPHLGGNGGSNHGRGSRSWCRVTPPPPGGDPGLGAEGPASPQGCGGGCAGRPLLAEVGPLG